MISPIQSIVFAANVSLYQYVFIFSTTTYTILLVDIQYYLINWNNNQSRAKITVLPAHSLMDTFDVWAIMWAVTWGTNAVATCTRGRSGLCFPSPDPMCAARRLEALIGQYGSMASSAKTSTLYNQNVFIHA